MTERFPLPSSEHAEQSLPTSLPIVAEARLLRLAGQPAEAVRLLRRRKNEESDDFQLHFELGLALSELDRHEEAIGAFLAAWRLNPGCDEACNRIGASFAARGMLQPAAMWFEQARQLNPTDTRFLYPYAAVLMKLGCAAQASELLTQWTSAEPDNPIASHLAAAALGCQETKQASPDYVRTLFNQYAPRFDDSLARLKYCGPQLVFHALRQTMTPDAEDLDILDLGCGTGLVGAALRPLARRLVGVDLSSEMLERARDRAVYDELVLAEMLDYLRTCSHRFHAVVAADVLTYVGDLHDFYRLSSQVLCDGGWIIAVVESLEDSGTFRLNPSGRFSHSAHYLRQVMQDSNFEVCEIRNDVMRYDAQRPVPTLVAVGKKVAAV